MSQQGNANLVVLGSGSVGKSAFTIMYIQQEFIDYYDPTIMDSYRRQDNVDEDIVFLDIVDTAGQAEFATMRDPYIKAGEGYLLMYSVADRNSFQELLHFRDQVLRVKDVQRFPCVVVGNKCDLPCQVTKEEGEKLAASLFRRPPTGDAVQEALGCKVPFFEASAKMDMNVKEAFKKLVKEVWRYRNIYAGNFPKPEKAPVAAPVPTMAPKGPLSPKGTKSVPGKKRGDKKKKEKASRPCHVLWRPKCVRENLFCFCFVFGRSI